jgi:hypothetical protein
LRSSFHPLHFQHLYSLPPAVQCSRSQILIYVCICPSSTPRLPHLTTPAPLRVSLSHPCSSLPSQIASPLVSPPPCFNVPLNHMFVRFAFKLIIQCQILYLTPLIEIDHPLQSFSHF